MDGQDTAGLRRIFFQFFSQPANMYVTPCGSPNTEPPTPLKQFVHWHGLPVVLCQDTQHIESWGGHFNQPAGTGDEVCCQVYRKIPGYDQSACRGWRLDTFVAAQHGFATRQKDIFIEWFGDVILQRRAPGQHFIQFPPAGDEEISGVW